MEERQDPLLKFGREIDQKVAADDDVEPGERAVVMGTPARIVRYQEC